MFMFVHLLISLISVSLINCSEYDTYGGHHDPGYAHHTIHHYCKLYIDYTDYTDYSLFIAFHFVYF